MKKNETEWGEEFRKPFKGFPYKVTLMSPRCNITYRFKGPTAEFALSYALDVLVSDVGKRNAKKYTRYRIEERRKVVKEGELRDMEATDA